MILNNQLYRVSKADRENKTYAIDFVTDSVIYKAHFPGHPITPGVCIIQIATELLSDLLGEELTLVKVKNAKFLVVIDPQETPSVSYNFSGIAIDESESTIKASVTVTSADVVFTKLSLIYKK